MVRNVGHRPAAYNADRVRLKVLFPVKTGIAWDRDAVFAWF